MCGIAGIWRRHGADATDPARLRAMLESIAHRGPDDHGTLLLDSRDGRCSRGHDAVGGGYDVILGSRRLAIIDLSPAGRQPMANARGDVFLLFNGEIYNHVELRRQLAARAHRFSSESDTEVILQAYEEWGTACVERFNGMWAFAIWDQRRRRFFCSRDRFGVKPFYYLLDDEVFVFASEIKAIVAAFPGSATPHHPTIHAFLASSALCRTEDTFFERIKRLPAAHNMTVTHDRDEQSRYWDYTTQSETYDQRAPAETFAALFDDSVRLRLRSDVPLGVALSGGIDSTAIAALARRHRGDATLKVFTATFPGTRFDERRWAELAAHRYGADLYVTEYRPRSLVEDLARVIWHLDYPALLPQVLPRWELMAMAARHVKVVLEGQGSDEMLAGYPNRYLLPQFVDELAGAISDGPAAMGRALVLAAARMYRRRSIAPLRDVAARALPIARRLRRSNRMRIGVLTPEFCARACGAVADPPPPRLYRDHLTHALHCDHARNVLPHLLKFGDAISMGHSLEVRLPFLDYRLVEFVFQLSGRHKLDGVESKIVLKRALRDVLPAEILGRKDKVGFYTPVGDWLRKFMASEVRPLLLSASARQRGIFVPVRLEEALARVERGDNAIAEQVFRWLSLEIWFRLFIDGVANPPAKIDRSLPDCADDRRGRAIARAR